MTENDSQAVAALPRTTTSTTLEGESTGRILAVLTPVEVCAVIPGQEYRGGVIT